MMSWLGLSCESRSSTLSSRTHECWCSQIVDYIYYNTDGNYLEWFLATSPFAAPHPFYNFKITTTTITHYNYPYNYNGSKNFNLKKGKTIMKMWKKYTYNNCYATRTTFICLRRREILTMINNGKVLHNFRQELFFSKVMNSSQLEMNSNSIIHYTWM